MIIVALYSRRRILSCKSSRLGKGYFEPKIGLDVADGQIRILVHDFAKLQNIIRKELSSSSIWLIQVVDAVS